MSQDTFENMVLSVVEACAVNKTKRVVTTGEVGYRDDTGKELTIVLTITAEPPVFGGTLYPPDDWSVKSSVWSQLKQLEPQSETVQ